MGRIVKPTTKVLLLNDAESGGGAEVVFQKTFSLMLSGENQIKVRKSSPYGGPLQGVLNGFGLINLIYTVQVTAILLFWRPNIVHIHNFCYRISFLPLVVMRGLKSLLHFSVIHTAHDFHLVCPNTGLLRYTKPAGFTACTACLDTGDWSHVIRNNCDRRGRFYSYVRYLRHRASYDWLQVDRLFDCILCPSKTLQDAIKRRFPDVETRLLRNPSFVSKKTASVSTGPVSKGRTLAFFGRLQPEKGILQYLREGYDRTAYPRFLIYGDGEEKGRIAKMIGSMELQDHVQLMGQIPLEEVASAISKVDAVVVPSLCQENCPLVICDALKLDKQIVLTERDGGGELLGEIRRVGKGFLDPSNYLMSLMSVYSDVLDDAHSEIK